MANQTSLINGTAYHWAQVSLTLLGRVYFIQKKYDSALNNYSQALELEPENYFTRKNIALILHKKKQ